MNFDQLYSEREPVDKDFTQEVATWYVECFFVFCVLIFVVYIIFVAIVLLFYIFLFSKPICGGIIEAHLE